MIVATALLVAIAFTAAFATPTGPPATSFRDSASSFRSSPSPSSGSLTARRRPENPIGWLLAIIGVLWSVVVTASFASTWALKTEVDPEDGRGVDRHRRRGLGPGARLDGFAAAAPSPRRAAALAPLAVGLTGLTLGLIALAMVGLATAAGKVEGVSGDGESGRLDASWARSPRRIRADPSRPPRWPRRAIRALRGGRRARTIGSSQVDRVRGAVFLVVYLVTFAAQQSGDDTTLGITITAISQASSRRCRSRSATPC